jgi:hypothetical protein
MPGMWDDIFAAGQGGFGANPYQRAAMPQSLPGPYDAPPQAVRDVAGFDPARAVSQRQARQLQPTPPRGFGVPSIRPLQPSPLAQDSRLGTPNFGNLMEQIAQLEQSGRRHPNLATQRPAPPPGGFGQFLRNERRLSPEQAAPDRYNPMQLEEQRRQIQAGQTPFVEDLNRLTRPTQGGIQQAPRRLMPHQIPQPRTPVEQMLPAQRMPKPMSPMFTGTLDREGREVFGELRRDPSQVPGRLAPQIRAAEPIQRAPQPGTTFGRLPTPTMPQPQGFGGMTLSPVQTPTVPRPPKPMSPFYEPRPTGGP